MSGIPPVMPDPPGDGQPRIEPGPWTGPTGWVWLVPGVVMLFLVFASLSSYLKPGRASLAQANDDLRQALTLQVRLDSLSALVPSLSEDDGPREVTVPDFSKQIAKVERRLAAGGPDRHTDEAKRLIVLAKDYSGSTVYKEEIDELAQSKDPVSQKVAWHLLNPAEPDEKEPPKGASFDERLAWTISGYDRPYEEAQVSAVMGIGASFRVLALAGAFVGAVFLGIVLLVGLTVALATKAVRPVGYLERISAVSADSLGLKFGLYLVAYVALGFVLGALGYAAHLPNVAVQVLTLLGILSFVPLIVRHRVLGHGHPVRTLLGDTTKPFKKLAIGAGVWLAMVPVEIGLTLLASLMMRGLPSPSHGIVEELKAAKGGATWLMLGFAAVVLAPLIEETMFRGVLFPALKRRFGRPLLAAVVCGALFAMIHPQGPILWPALAVVGASAAMVTYYTGSLIPALSLHACQNFAALAANWLMNP